MTRVFIIRHAEAEGNLYRRGQGHMDGKVTVKGLGQIDALAERFKDEQIDDVYSSDMSRTRETAGAILRYRPGLTLKTDPRLREINMGVWEDRSWGDIAHETPEMLQYFNHDPEKWFVPGGESFEHLQKRITAAVLDIASRHDGRTIAIFSHGMAIRSLMCEILGIPSKDAMTVQHCENTAVALLETDNAIEYTEAAGTRARIIFRNDRSHLPKSLSIMETQSWWKNKSGSEENNLRFEPLDLENDAEFYREAYRGAWIASHGTDEGFAPDVCLERVRENIAAHPLAVMKAMRGETAAGVIELDVRHGESEGCGWLTLCCIAEGHRSCRLGPQLIGHAAHVYRRLGRKVLRLHVFEGNERAIRFYEGCGFHKIGRAMGALGQLILMERPL
jgi:probable phosphoglycerate mutase